MEASESLDVGSKLKNFDDIPGPWSLPVIGTLYKYLPYIGEYNISEVLVNAVKKYEKYGSLVRETILPGVNLLYVYDPNDIEIIMKYSGKHPERRSHLAIGSYRKTKPDIYNDAGILSTNGEEWYKIRSTFQKSISLPRAAALYLNTVNFCVDDFIERIKLIHADKGLENVSDSKDDISRLFLKIIQVIAFDAQIDIFSEEELKEDSLSSKMMHNSILVNGMMVELDITPSFLYNTYFPPYKMFYDAMQYLENVALDLIQKKIKIRDMEKNSEVKLNGELSLLETYLADPEIDIKDIIGISVDILLAGMDTTSYSTCMALYHLAKNPEAQQKLYEEALQLLPNPNSCVDSNIIGKATYLKACLKESLRINPISLGTSRYTTENIILSGYKIPKGTVCITCNQVTSNLSKYVEYPDRFIPERWIQGSEHYKRFHPFLTIPFGHGARMCIAKRLAEQNMHITLLKVIRNFELSWVGNDLKTITKSISIPEGPVNILFVTRKE